MKLILITLLMTISFGLIGCDGKAAEIPNKAAPKKSVARPANAVLAPDFTLTTVHGEWVKLNELRGKVVLLNFWATWCPPCRREIPDFIKLYDKYKKDGLEIVGVTLEPDDQKTVQEFMNKYGMNYDVLISINKGDTQKVAANFGQATKTPITGIPTTFIIDREGYIVKRYIGPRTEEIFYNDLKPYL